MQLEKLSYDEVTQLSPNKSINYESITSCKNEHLNAFGHLYNQHESTTAWYVCGITAKASHIPIPIWYISLFDGRLNTRSISLTQTYRQTSNLRANISSAWLMVGKISNINSAWCALQYSTVVTVVHFVCTCVGVCHSCWIYKAPEQCNR